MTPGNMRELGCTSSMRRTSSTVNGQARTLLIITPREVSISEVAQAHPGLAKRRAESRAACNSLSKALWNTFG
jgi:hypothetical protein